MDKTITVINHPDQKEYKLVLHDNEDGTYSIQSAVGNPNIDLLTKAINSIDWEHHEVHQGNTFTVSFRSAAVANDGYLRIHLKPAIKDCHLKLTYACEGKALFKSYSGSTYSNIGTELTPWNRSIGSANVADTKVYHTPTVTPGILRVDEFVGTGGATAQRAGGVGGTSIETIIEAGQDLLLELQNKSGSASDLQLTISFYEIEG